LKDRLNEVTFFFGSSADAFWHSLAGEDGTEVMKSRLKAKMYLAKYAHISPFEWEHREVSQLHEHFAALSEMIRETKGGFAED
jgi:hypothetical protein